MRRLALAALAAIAFTAVPAQAQQARGGELSVYAIGSYYWADFGAGIGARYQLPLVPEGILHARVRDDLAIDFGVDYVHVDFGRWPVAYDPYYGYYTYADVGYNALIPTVGLLWNFWLTPKLAVYPKIDAGFAFGWWSHDWYGPGPDMHSFFVQGAAGATLKIANNLSLKGELGSGMLKFGVQFRL